MPVCQRNIIPSHRIPQRVLGNQIEPLTPHPQISYAKPIVEADQVDRFAVYYGPFLDALLIVDEVSLVEARLHGRIRIQLMRGKIGRRTVKPGYYFFNFRHINLSFLRQGRVDARVLLELLDSHEVHDIEPRKR